MKRFIQKERGLIYFSENKSVPFSVNGLVFKRADALAFEEAVCECSIDKKGHGPFSPRSQTI